MLSCRLAAMVLAATLVSSAAFGQGMSVGGGAFDSVDPFSSDPFANATGDFGVDDPGNDGPDFTGRDALAILRGVSFDDADLPDGFTVMTVEETPSTRYDQNQGAIGEVRLRLDAAGHDAAVIWRAYDDSGSSVGALSQLAQSVGQRFKGAPVEELHPTIGENGFTCALVRPAADRVNITCGQSVGLDPLQALGIVDAPLKKGKSASVLVERAATLAAWGRQQWTRIENERHSG